MREASALGGGVFDLFTLHKADHGGVRRFHRLSRGQPPGAVPSGSGNLHWPTGRCVWRCAVGFVITSKSCTECVSLGTVNRINMLCVCDKCFPYQCCRFAHEIGVFRHLIILCKKKQRNWLPCSHVYWTEVLLIIKNSSSYIKISYICWALSAVVPRTAFLSISISVWCRTGARWGRSPI